MTLDATFDIEWFDYTPPPQLPDLDDGDGWRRITRPWYARFTYPDWEGPTSHDIDHLLGPEYRMAAVDGQVMV